MTSGTGSDRQPRPRERPRATPRPRAGSLKRAVKLLLLLGFLLALLAAGSMGVCFRRGMTAPPERQVVDVTQLVRIPVDRVVHPHATAEVQELMARHAGPVSVGGGRFSMGGQIGTEGTLFLDMREMNDVLSVDPAAHTARVEAGATWRRIQEAIDPQDLSIAIMQSYANFTVGGSLSVNGHGRYVNEGPVVHAVRSLEVVLADGRRVHASREENPEIFHGVVGGYGGIGVITEVELRLADNEPLERAVERMGVEAFPTWFAENVAGSRSAVFFNADVYPPDYDELVAITFSRTDRDVTVPDRLQEQGTSSAADRFTYWWVSEAPLGKQARSEIVDRMRLGGRPVVWRNYEASYDARGLEPASRERSTYVLQEYFVPVDRFLDFLPEMAAVFAEHRVNVMNVSIRHASADPDSLLSWAPGERFAFVVYYKQGTSAADQEEVGRWTRELIDRVLAVGGTWYLPYQPHATDAQLERGYPRFPEYVDLKMGVDPQYELRNTLLDTYLPPARARARGESDREVRARLAAREGYARPEDQTFLTLPEWYIVYSADELGAFLESRPPSAFPWLASVCQFCEIYGAVTSSASGRYPFNTGYHAMIWVIGASYAVEYAVKAAYEGTVGRLAEAAWGHDGPEDAFVARLARDYGAFLHHTPWYAFPYGERAEALAQLVGAGGVRAAERRFATRIELALKGALGRAMGGASGAAYGVEEAVIHAWARGRPAEVGGIEGVEVAEVLGEEDLLLRIPRYEPFTRAVITLAARGVELVEIAGGRTLVVQVRAPGTWDRADLFGDRVVRWPILTESDTDRVALEVPVDRLNEVLPALASEPGVTVEHLYDY